MNIIKTMRYLGWVRMEPGERMTIILVTAPLRQKLLGYLKLKPTLKAELRQKRLLMLFKERCAVSFTYETVEL